MTRVTNAGMLVLWFLVASACSCSPRSRPAKGEVDRLYDLWSSVGQNEIVDKDMPSRRIAVIRASMASPESRLPIIAYVMTTANRADDLLIDESGRHYPRMFIADLRAATTEVAIEDGDVALLRMLLSSQCPDYYGIQYVEARLVLDLRPDRIKYRGLDVLFDAYASATDDEVASCLYDAITRAIGHAGEDAAARREWFDRNRDKLVVNEAYVRLIRGTGVEAADRGPYLLVGGE